MRYNALSMGIEETPKIDHSLWDFVALPEDRATATGNTHKIGKDRARDSGDIFVADRQRYSSQYFAKI